MKNSIPDIMYYVYFTKNNLKNINPCRFTNYNDAYNYARKYDKSLIYSKIIPYTPSENGGSDKQSQIIFDRLMRKIISKKVSNSKIIYTYNYNNHIKNTIIIDTKLLLYKNVLFDIHLESHLHRVEIEDFKNNVLENDLLVPYNDYYGSKNTVFFKQRHITNENRYLLFDNKDVYYTNLFDSYKAALINCFGSIQVHVYKDDNENSITYYCRNNYSIFNYCRKLFKFIHDLPIEAINLNRDYLVNFSSIISGTFDLPAYKNHNNYNKYTAATDFIYDFLKY